MKDLRGGSHATQTFEVGGRRWLVVATPKRNFVSPYVASLPWAATAGGFLTTALFVLYLLRRQQWRAREVEAENALRASESQYRMVTDALPVGIIYLDAQHRHRFVNAVIERWAQRPRDQILGRTLTEIMGPNLLEMRGRQILAALRGEITVAEGPVTHPDGVLRYTRATFHPHIGVSGRIEGCFGLIEDVTEQKHTEDLLRQSQKMEAVGQLTGGVAHDFNNLLAVILGNLQLAERRLDGDAPVRQQIARAVRATKRGAELVKRLLAFSRRQVLEPKILSLNELVAGMEDLLRRTLGEAVEIATVLNADPWPVEVDPAQMETAVLNLVVNARDAMPRSGRLTLETVNVTLDDDYIKRHAYGTVGDHVCLAVSDTGHGMAADVVRRAFEPFFTTKPQGKGTGLGLSMVYGFVRQSGGHVEIYSEVGRGTTVKIYLPRAKHSHEATEGAVAAAEGV